MLISRSFQSFKDFVDYCEVDHPNDHAFLCASEKMPSKFTGVATKEEAFSLCRNGFPEGKAAMQEVLDSLKEQISLPSEQFQFVPSIEGSAPDVQAFILGLPDDMLFMEPISIDAPPTSLTIQMGLGYPGGTNLNQVRLAGAVIFAAQEALKLQGCSLNLILSSTIAGYGDDDLYQTSFPISSNIDLDTFSFIYTHPAMLRVLVFASREHEDAQIRRMFGVHYPEGGYGKTTHALIDGCDASLTFQEIVRQCNSMDDAKRVFNHLVSSKFNSQPTLK